MVKYLEEKDDFEEIINSDNYLVDFYADWCGPCKMMSTVLETLNDVNVLKVNTDTFGDISQKFGIMSIPTLIYFKEGNEANKAVGFRTKEEIEKMISES